MKRRGSGILLHLTSLPSPFGIGDMGPWAYRFADFLAESRQSYWQILPLNPTNPVHANSPYHSTSAFAGSRLLISPEMLVQEGWLQQSDLASVPDLPREKVDYRAVHAYKEMLLALAYERFARTDPPYEYERFCLEQAGWLEDFALYMALKFKFSGQAWGDWPVELRDRRAEALRAVQKELADGINKEKFRQYLFFQQWTALKNYCNQRGIQILGDVPIYVNYDSADVWVHPEIFKLDGSRKPYAVAGVPPDYFSKTGQRWGNPVYRWDVIKEREYPWWTSRIAHNLKLFDLVRIDHFLGLVAYWEIPAAEKTAVNGQWIKAPAREFFYHLTRQFPYLPILAEDLGLVTPEVREVMNEFEFPGIKVLLFAFGPDLPTNPYIPHNFPRRCVAYTGTHDNNTAKGWFTGEASPEEKKRIFRYLGREVSAEEFPGELIRLIMRSGALTAIFPLQDILGLGEEARMNRPATTQGNWEWRLSPESLTPEVIGRLREWTEIYGRG